MESTNKMIRVGVLGAGGRMGKSNISAIYSDSRMQLVSTVDQEGHLKLGEDAGRVAGLVEFLGVPISTSIPSLLEGSDVVIDFTEPKSTLSVLVKNLDYKKAFVIGTTGFTEEQQQEIRNYANDFPIVQSPNFSVGVHALLRITEKTAELLNRDKDYDLEIVEMHHRFKKDAPSGTALKLAEIADKHSGRGKGEFSYRREGKTKTRDIDEIGIVSLRAGDTIGEHRVIFATLGERIEVNHIATSRETFSKGVILACKWLYEKQKSHGLYGMDDILGFNI